MKLTRLYGKRAIEFHDGKLNYKTQSGFVDLPDHLVQRAINSGFSRMNPNPPAPPVVEVEATASPASIDPTGSPASGVAPTLESQPATQVSGLPGEHPQAQASAAVASKEDLDARLRGRAGAT